jgi:hypothetical protein
MNKLSSRNLLVGAALFAIAAESAWSEEAAPSVPAAPAEQTASPVTGFVPEYAPTPGRRGYEPYWQPAPRPGPPPGYYGRFQPYYPPNPQYRSAPAVKPLSAELKQTQEQLAAEHAELDTAREQLARLQAEQEAIREILHQTQSELAKASEQLSIVLEEMDILNEVLSKLKGRLDVQDTSLLGALNAGAAEEDEVGSAGASEAGQLHAPATLSVQPENAGGEQAPASDDEQAIPEAE